MDHLKILKRAWEITWRYRVLWVFGVILALTTSSWRMSGSGGGGSGRGSGGNGGDYSWGYQFEDLSPQVQDALIAAIIGLVCLVVLVAIVSVIARYVAETALIRMVDDYEQTGRRRSVRQGFRLGWSRATLRLFLIDLVLFLPMALGFILLALFTLAPLLLWATDNPAAGAVGTVATVGLCFLTIISAIVAVVALILLAHFCRRVCVLEGLDVIESVRQGYAMVRRHLKDVGIMWLIMVGVDLAWMAAMVPVAILLVIVGAILGGLLALIAGGLTALAAGGATPWIVAIVVGIPIFLAVLIVPLACLGGLVETFKSSVWTLTYRELRALEDLE
jgi:hypothetical protein